MRRRVAAHREVIIVHRVEARVAVPGFVEVDPIAGFLEQRLRAHGVVAQAVVVQLVTTAYTGFWSAISFVSEPACAFARIVFGSISEGGIGPMMP